MSYVLDALRKSEQERQRLASKSSSILHPVMVEENRLLGLLPAMLAGAVITAVVVALLWWVWLQPPEAVEPGPAEKTLAASQQPPAAQKRENAPQPAAAKATPVPPPAAIKRAAVPTVKKGTPPAAAGGQSATAASKTEADDDPLKGMPALVISGYMHDDQAGSMAIINDKLVHEGEEIAPGLRLEKIVGNSAILNYNGHEFRR
ncbi:MAG TPA: general secretion pathway protein GspB [Gallionella sp.]|nr:general secretion pathway protein GspB [Gallionella sp.]